MPTGDDRRQRDDARVERPPERFGSEVGAGVHHDGRSGDAFGRRRRRRGGAPTPTPTTSSPPPRRPAPPREPRARVHGRRVSVRGWEHSIVARLLNARTPPLDDARSLSTPTNPRDEISTVDHLKQDQHSRRRSRRARVKNLPKIIGHSEPRRESPVFVTWLRGRLRAPGSARARSLGRIEGVGSPPATPTPPFARRGPTRGREEGRFFPEVRRGNNPGRAST